MAERNVKLNVEVNLEKANEEMNKFGKFQQVNEKLIANFYKHSGDVISNLGKWSVASKDIENRMKALDKMNLKAFASVEKLNEERMKGLVAEIEAEGKKAKALDNTNKLYKQKEDLIKEQSKVAEKRIEKEYQIMIDAAREAGADVEAIEKAKADNIAIIQKKLREDLKKNDEEYFAAQKAFTDKNLKETTELLTKNIYHGKEKLDKDSEEKKKRLEEENKKQQELLTARYSKERMLNEANGMSVTDLDNKLIAQREALDIVHKAKLAKINEEAAKKAKGTATEVAKQTTDKAEETAKKTEETAKKTEDSWKRIINVGAMSDNIKEGIKQLKHYDQALTASMEEETLRFNNLEKNYQGDKEGFEELQQAKKEVLAKYAAEKIRIEEMITTAEAKEQGLRMEQLKQYLNNVQVATNEIKGALTKTADYFGTAFTSISSVYKAEIAGIDEELAHYANKSAEAEKIVANHDQYLKDLNAEKEKATKEGNSTLVTSLQERIDKEESLYNESVDTKRKYDIKEQELEREKAKKQKEQEKIEKLNRKATLLKNIGEATANVAQGVAKTLGAYPWPFNIALAALVGAAGAVQIGIMTKQLAKFEDGGLLKGKRHSQGGMRIEGTNIEVEGGEYVVNRESTNKNFGLVRYINSQRKELTPTDINGFFAKASQGYKPPFRRQFETGGEIPVIERPASIDNEALVDAIKSIKFAPKVAVTDILRVQDEMTHVDGWSGI